MKLVTPHHRAGCSSNRESGVFVREIRSLACPGKATEWGIVSRLAR